MRISSIVINNYKSIGTDRNTLLLEDDVTALIGKNDCGKSNVLEILGAISFNHYILDDYFKFNNSLDKEVSLTVELKFTSKELKLLKDYRDIEEDNTYFYFFQNKEIEFKGGFSRLFNEDRELIKAIYYLKQNLIFYFREKYNNILDDKFIKEVKEYIEAMENLDNIIWIKYKKKINKLLYILNSYNSDYFVNEDKEGNLNIKYDEKKYTLIRYLQTIKSKIRKKYLLLPMFYYRKGEDNLQNEYHIEEIKKEIKDKNGAFYKFLLASDINIKIFLTAIENENNWNIYKGEIKEKVESNIQEKFNEFYGEENIQIKIHFKRDVLNILIKTNENTTNIGSRSNGLKWYLNLFIDILANDIKDTNVIFLLDEPGVYLHVNAQRELLKLFYALCKNENQVVYSTHSPYMIDSDNIINIRAIEKDEKDNTNIYNTAYDINLNGVSKRETLSPLIQAIGADLRFNIGPQGEKLNIITEGITDYMYYMAMFYYLDVDENNIPYIIPSVGAGNINVIVSILIGWGCDFKVILDYDKAGFVECDKLIENLHLKINEDIFFVNCKDKYDNKSKEIYRYPEFVESLISEKDKAKFSISYLENKTLAAKEFYDKVKNKSVKLTDETVNNFKKLFTYMKLL